MQTAGVDYGELSLHAKPLSPEASATTLVIYLSGPPSPPPRSLTDSSPGLPANGFLMRGVPSWEQYTSSDHLPWKYAPAATTNLATPSKGPQLSDLQPTGCPLIGDLSVLRYWKDYID